jgi:hypothetical protein
MPSLADIHAFIGRVAGVPEKCLLADCDLERDVGITGDDFDELIIAFAEEFGVNMDCYLWYFHHAEEVTFNPGALFFRPPYRRVKHIPVTPELLLSSASTGSWPDIYPEHSIPSRRYDLLLNYFLIAAGCLLLAVALL